MKVARRTVLICLAATILPVGVWFLWQTHARGGQSDEMLVITARDRVKQKDGSYQVRLRHLHWNPKQTAIIICDMWDDHYCIGAAKRVAEMAPQMNKVISEARERGVLIIHCPSGCMNVYQDTPQRKLAQQAPKVKTKVALKGWCHLDPKNESALPIDDSVPCDDENPRPAKRFYSKQIETLKIEEGDAITDSAEAYYLMKQKGVKNAIIMGVHTNMCVLGRPFGIRQLVYQGMNVVLMRDMTDAMYNPKMKPYVSHFRGTELVIEHIERHWCPTIASTAFTGDAPFRFKNDKRKHVVFIVGGGEYDANKSMPQFAHTLRDKHGLYCDVLLGQGKNEDYQILGLRALNKADLMVMFLRRRAIPKEQMQHIWDYFEAGKPLVALRTSSHGFETDKAPVGYSTWPGFDRLVLGCDYRGHGPGKLGTDVKVVAAKHPILEGLKLKQWHSNASLYSSAPVAKKATVLLEGSFKDKTQPIAWTHSYRGGRIFYTSLGHLDDFQQPEFRRMLVNAVFWGMEMMGN